MDMQQNKRSLLIGGFIFAFLVFAAGVGMWLFSKNTDNRSQAAAAPVAAIRIISQKSTIGAQEHTVLVDVSQMKTGTTVTDFSAQIFVAKKEFTPPEQVTQMPRPSYYPIPSSYPKPSYTQVTPSMYPQKVTATPQPYARAITATPAPETSVLGVSTTELAALPPGTVVTAMPSRTITKEPIPSGPVQEAFLARSSDGVLAVKGLGQFAKLQNLRVSVDSSDKGYAVTFSAQASAKDLELQKAFAQPQALLAISVTEMKAAILMPVVQVASVKGYLPGMKTVVELTKQEVKPTVAPTPTAKPPVVVSTCRTTKDCPKGYTCTPPKTPSCPPGKACAAVRLQWQCTLMKPSPTIQRFPSKMPPPKVTGRQEIIIKSVQ